MVVHGIPGPYELRRGDILSIDVGVTYEGWVADAAITVPIGETPEHAEPLLSTTKDALFEGIEQCAQFAEVTEAKQELHATVGKLVRRAQRSGAIRSGLDSQDIGALVGAAIQASWHAERGDAWRRYVQVVLDGLRRSD